ncbi:hypothetical protein L1887_03856 [Cichorium endivia]|nr:hypothetical protein L1887_03856 [Cichorium endivia]
MATLTVPPTPVSPHDDAIKLYKAFKGFGCDTEAVINILAHQDSTQRAHIQHEYRTMYSDDILKRLSSELSGKLETITFGDKSRMGRGGIDAKVKPASNAAYSGTPVVIARMTMNSIKIVFGITLYSVNILEDFGVGNTHMTINIIIVDYSSISAVLPEGAPIVDPRTHLLKKPTSLALVRVPPTLLVYDTLAPAPAPAPLRREERGERSHPNTAPHGGCNK